jgi:hypothetical protein
LVKTIVNRIHVSQKEPHILFTMLYIQSLNVFTRHIILTSQIRHILWSLLSCVINGAIISQWSNLLLMLVIISSGWKNVKWCSHILPLTIRLCLAINLHFVTGEEWILWPQVQLGENFVVIVWNHRSVVNHCCKISFPRGIIDGGLEFVSLLKSDKRLVHHDGDNSWFGSRPAILLLQVGTLKRSILNWNSARYSSVHAVWHAQCRGTKNVQVTVP